MLGGGPFFVWTGELIGEQSFGLLDSGINPAEALTWSWKKARSRLVSVLGIGLGIGLLSGLLSGLGSGLGIMMPGGLGIKLPGGLGFWLITGLQTGLIGGLGAGLFFVLVSGLSGRQLRERLSLSPNEGIWRSGRNGLFVGLGFWLIFGLVVWLGFLWVSVWAVNDLGIGLWLLFGPIVGLIIGLAMGLDAFMKHFILRIFLSMRGDLPWNLVALLDEAAERLLLRKVGGSYIFVHRQLLDYFAQLAEEK